MVCSALFSSHAPSLLLTLHQCLPDFGSPREAKNRGRRDGCSCGRQSIRETAQREIASACLAEVARGERLVLLSSPWSLPEMMTFTTAEAVLVVALPYLLGEQDHMQATWRTRSVCQQERQSADWIPKVIEASHS